jgi:pimeloyl-ACP methyl ester carboxylesterase
VPCRTTEPHEPEGWAHQVGVSDDLLGAPRDVMLPSGPVRYHDRGSGPVVVFVHGIIANADVWRNVVPALSDTYRCVAPDWPLGGHRLPMKPGTDFTLFGLARLVSQFLAALDLQDVTLVGNDTGGAIVQAVAARHPGRLARIVLTPCDAFDNFLPLPIRHLQVFGRTRPGLRILAEFLRSTTVQRWPIAFGRLTERPIAPAIMTSYVEPLRTSAGVRADFAALVRAISPRLTEDVIAGLERFDKPALIAWARERRPFFPLAHAYRLAGHLPDARVVVIEDSGPFVTEDRPAAVARLLREFIPAVTSAAHDR